MPRFTMPLVGHHFWTPVLLVDLSYYYNSLELRSLVGFLRAIFRISGLGKGLIVKRVILTRENTDFSTDDLSDLRDIGHGAVLFLAVCFLLNLTVYNYITDSKTLIISNNYKQIYGLNFSTSTDHHVPCLHKIILIQPSIGSKF
mgnify:CR=1 FL=1